jgi:mRNA interferase RelE/StbE
LTTYKLRFHTLALAEWKKLDGSVRAQFKKKLEERLLTPRVPSAALSGMADCYKIKLRAARYRLVCRVDDGEVWVTVISIGLRERLQAYTRAPRFGPLSAEVTRQFEHATPEQLETWTDRVLDARTIEEVFAEG